MLNNKQVHKQSSLVKCGRISIVQARKRVETTTLDWSNFKINIKLDKEKVFSVQGK